MLLEQTGLKFPDPAPISLGQYMEGGNEDLVCPFKNLHISATRCIFQNPKDLAFQGWVKSVFIGEVLRQVLEGISLADLNLTRLVVHYYVDLEEKLAT
jgi:hypothetical protein